MTGAKLHGEQLPGRPFGGGVRVLVALAALAAAASGCQRGNLAQTMAKPPRYERGERCSAKTTPSLRPLVVEWSAADRASLEARLRRGVVAVRYEGCSLEVLRGCEVRGRYGYAGITRKREQVAIHNADELYAQLPVGAAQLEGKLARAGQLRVEMTLVGMLEADQAVHTRDDLSGPCEGATHVITGVQVGAYHFYAGGEAEIGASGGAGGAGAGARSSARQEVLNSDGDAAACEAAREADGRPPEGCGALLRVEVAAIAAERRPPECPSGSAWDGARCTVTQVFCPAGTQVVEGRCVAPIASRGGGEERAGGEARAGSKAAPDPDEAVCSPLCDRQLACEAEAQDIALPEGQALARFKNACMKQCRWVSSDLTRPQLRRCQAAASCAEFRACMEPRG